MRNLGFQIGGQIDDIDGTKRAFLGTNPASYTQAFRYESNFGFRGHFDTELAGPDDRARFFAFLTTFLSLY